LDLPASGDSIAFERLNEQLIARSTGRLRELIEEIE